MRTVVRVHIQLVKFIIPSSKKELNQYGEWAFILPGKNKVGKKGNVYGHAILPKQECFIIMGNNQVLIRHAYIDG